jgi:hypothetical protein
VDVDVDVDVAKTVVAYEMTKLGQETVGLEGARPLAVVSVTARGLAYPIS